MAHPERFLVAHPFNPVYLLPLVELCGGSSTSPETIERAASLYRALGMHPLVVRHEIDGFIADRLLEALWREALWLVHDGVATAEEIDDALRYGPGLRWSTMGTFLIYRLAGGEAGMRHFMAQFGPTLELPSTKLTDVPELDDELLDTLVAQSDAQAAGRSIEELARIRDDCLVAVLSGLRGQAWGAGVDVAATERRWQRAAAVPRARRCRRLPADGLLHLHEVIVAPEWIDYNGHMTEYRYLQVLADTTDVFLPLIGAGGDYAASGSSFYTVETHIRHLGEARAGDRLTVSTQLLATIPSGCTCSTRSAAPTTTPRSRPGSTCCCTSRWPRAAQYRRAPRCSPRSIGSRPPRPAARARGRRPRDRPRRPRRSRIELVARSGGWRSAIGCGIKRPRRLNKFIKRRGQTCRQTT